MSRPRYTKAEQDLYQTIGQRLEGARERQQLSRAQVAAKVKVSGPTIIAIERGVNRMTLHRFMVMCRVLKLDWREVLGESAPSNLEAIEHRIQHELAKLMMEDNTLSATVVLQRAAKTVHEAMEAVKEEAKGE